MHSGTGLAGAGQSGLADDRLRLLVWATLGSLVLHALILLLLSGFQEFVQGRAAPPPLTARLVKPPPPETPKAETPPPKPPIPRPAAKTQPQPAAAPAVQPAPPAAVLSVEQAKPASESAFVVPPAPAAQPQVAPIVPQASARSEPAPAAAASGPDPGSVARYRLELMEIARRYKRYPRIAQDNNWEGRVELRIAFAESGAISSMTVKKGAGRAVLDEEAQAMIRSAQPQAAIPPALRGKAFVLEIPVDFLLREER